MKYKKKITLLLILIINLNTNFTSIKKTNNTLFTFKNVLFFISSLLTTAISILLYLEKNNDNMEKDIEKLVDKEFTLYLEIKKSSKPYKKLLKQNKKLLAQYETLLKQNKKLLAQYETLLKQNKKLLARYETLTTEYIELKEEYTKLTKLKEEYTELTKKIQETYSSKKQYIRILRLKKIQHFLNHQTSIQNNNMIIESIENIIQSLETQDIEEKSHGINFMHQNTIYDIMHAIDKYQKLQSPLNIIDESNESEQGSLKIMHSINLMI